MNSPLAISSIAVSRSEHDSSSGSLQFSPKHFRFHPRSDNGDNPHSHYHQAFLPHPAGSNPLPVLVHLKRQRILAGAVTFGACVAALMYVFTDGVVVARFSGPNASHRAIQRIDDYNFYVGMITALFVKPLLMLVSLVVPVAMLCFATRAYMQKKRTWRTQLVILLIMNVLLWLLSNGFHAANVHTTEPRVQLATSSADLSLSSSSDTITNETAADSQSTAVVNSILRTAVQSPQPPQQSVSCTRKSPQRLPAHTEFGFPLRAWFAEMLPAAPAPEGSLKIQVADLSSEPLTSTRPFPITLASARSLFTYSLHLMNAFFRDPTNTAAAGSSNNQSVFELDLPSDFGQASQTDSANTVSAFYGAMEDTLSGIFNASTSYPHFTNFNMDDANVEFVKYQFSPQLAFEGITWDIPLAATELRRHVFLSADNDTTDRVVYGENDAHVFEINAKEECSWNGCVISPKGAEMSGAAADYGSQVRALSICLGNDGGAEDRVATLDETIANCPTKMSESTMLVFSFAKRITGDEINCALNNTAGLVTMINATKYYTVTVGRLSWNSSSIADAFHASCVSPDGCDGLYFPLTGGEKVAVVGKPHLPLGQLQKFSSSSSWASLVGSNVQEIDEGGALKNDFVFPRNFHRVNSWDGIEGRYCEQERGGFLDLVARDHLYSEESLQPAYMSALFWLFQNAIVIETRPLSGTSLSSEKNITTASTLAFSGNIEWVDAEVSIPKLSAVLTCVGCAILVLLSVAVQLGGKRKEAEIEKFFFAHHLARLVIGDDAMPHHLVKCNLLSVANDRLGSSEHLDEFEITGLALSHCKDPGNVLYVPKQHTMITASSASFLSSGAAP
uniref:Transmembrane protein n=1 Tax=Globisporangium ultimum (strain ATCC 200006 / CBS 805.95 / DAOM BR144) TaxID=431595 RepID=K3W857_GLOUD